MNGDFERDYTSLRQPVSMQVPLEAPVGAGLHDALAVEPRWPRRIKENQSQPSTHQRCKLAAFVGGGGLPMDIIHWVTTKLMIMKLRRTEKASEVQKRFKTLSAIAPGTLEYLKAYTEYVRAVEKELEKSRITCL